MHNPTSVLENGTHKLLWDFEIQTEHQISARRPDQQKKRTCRMVDFAAPADHRVKFKECEKRNKFLYLARDLEKLWNMKVTIIPIVIGLGTVNKVLVQGLEDLEISGRVETIQTTALLRSTRILQRVLETWGDLLSLKLQWETICWCEKLSKEKNNYNNSRWKRLITKFHFFFYSGNSWQPC